MLAGRYPSDEFAELRPRVVWDRTAGTVRGRDGSRALAVQNAGTIPDRGLYAVVLPDGARVGELDEEMVYEARSGQTFMLGRLDLADRGDHPGPRGGDARPRRAGGPALLEGGGRRPAVRAGRGGGAAGPRADRRRARPRPRRRLRADSAFDARAASNLVAYLEDQAAATGTVPSDRAIVVERFRDEIGDWRLCVLTPFGARVHAPWALALGARLRAADRPRGAHDLGRRRHRDPPARRRRGAGRRQRPDRPRRARRAGAGRAGRDRPLRRALPRERGARPAHPAPAARAPHAAVAAAPEGVVAAPGGAPVRQLPGDPGDVPRVPATTGSTCRRCAAVLGRVASRELAVVEVETATASPFAGSLLFEYVASYMYEDDTPVAERRAQALSLNRDLLRELLGQEELRDLIDADALAALEADLQGLSERARARGRRRAARPAAPHRRPDRRRDRAPGGRAGRGRPTWIERAGGRAARVRGAGGRRGARDRRRGRRPLPRRTRRDAAGRAARRLPGGRSRTRCRASSRATPAPAGPFHITEPADRYALDRAAAGGPAGGARDRGHAGARRAAARRLGPRVVRRRGRAPAAAREPGDAARARSSRPTRARSGASCPTGSGSTARAARAAPTPCARCSAACRGWRCRPPSGRARCCPRRVADYGPAWLDELAARGRDRVGGRRGRRRRRRPGGDLLPRGRPAAGPAPRRPARPRTRWPTALRAALAGGASFWDDLLVAGEATREEVFTALWGLVWAGEVTNDLWLPLRAPRRLPALTRPGAGARGAAGSAAGRGARRPSRAAGRWPGACSPTRRRARRAPPRPGRAAGGAPRRADPLGRRSPRASRAGTRRSTRHWPTWRPSGLCRRGYFVEGLGGAQFALAGRGRAAARPARPPARRTAARRWCSARPTPPSPTAPPSPGRRARGRRSPVARVRRRRSCWSTARRRCTSSAAGGAC